MKIYDFLQFFKSLIQDAAHSFYCCIVLKWKKVFPATQPNPLVRGLGVPKELGGGTVRTGDPS